VVTGHESPVELRVAVADIVIAVCGEHIDRGSLANNPYQGFITKDNADVRLQIQRGSLAKDNGENILFDTTGVWTLAQKNGRYILRTTSGTAVLDSRLRSGEIYSAEDPGKDFALSYPLDEILMINLLAQGRGILVHACGIIQQGHGLLFIGSSGAGKSTTANLWKNEKETVILSDDRIIIRKIDSQYWMYGTPWHGDAKLASPARVPLERIYFLQHAPENKIQELRPLNTVSRLMTCSFPPFWDKEGLDFTLRFCTELAQSIPSCKLGFVPDKRVLDLIRTKM
jgi:hypothetical protein